MVNRGLFRSENLRGFLGGKMRGAYAYCGGGVYPPMGSASWPDSRGGEGVPALSTPCVTALHTGTQGPKPLATTGLSLVQLGGWTQGGHRRPCKGQQGGSGLAWGVHGGSRARGVRSGSARPQAVSASPQRTGPARRPPAGPGRAMKKPRRPRGPTGRGGACRGL